MAMFHSMNATGAWAPERGTNLLDTGSHFYDVYECSGGGYISLGSIEPQFYAELMRLTGLEGDEAFAKQMQREEWPQLKVRISELFKTKTRDEWCAIMEHSDVCFAPVLSLDEAPLHPHNVERDTFVEVAGVIQPAPSPRFSRTVAQIQGPPAHPGQDTDRILADAGYDSDDIAKLRDAGAVA
jgi:alpha-methylacyl-CoA racemase